MTAGSHVHCGFENRDATAYYSASSMLTNRTADDAHSLKGGAHPRRNPERKRERHRLAVEPSLCRRFVVRMIKGASSELIAAGGQRRVVDPREQATPLLLGGERLPIARADRAHLDDSACKAGDVVGHRHRNERRICG